MFYFLDELDAAKIHVVVLCSQGTLFVDALGQVAVRVDELACAEQEGKMLVVVEAPDTMGAGWLKPVSGLDLPHEQDVLLEYLVDRSTQVSFL